MNKTVLILILFLFIFLFDNPIYIIYILPQSTRSLSSLDLSNNISDISFHSNTLECLLEKVAGKNESDKEINICVNNLI